jgi:hypothetical protein
LIDEREREPQHVSRAERAEKGLLFSAFGDG